MKNKYLYLVYNKPGEVIGVFIETLNNWQDVVRQNCGDFAITYQAKHRAEIITHKNDWFCVTWSCAVQGEYIRT